MNHLDIELRAWPPGSVGRVGVMAIHTPTGVAVIVRSERSSAANQKLAVERLGILLSEAVSPGAWTP